MSTVSLLDNAMCYTPNWKKYILMVGGLTVERRTRPITFRR